jgi:BASS family bile acid:Na+ symporter
MELSELLAPLLSTLISLTVMMTLFVMGLGMTFKEAFYLWREPKKLIITLLSAMVFVVISGVVLLYAFEALGVAIPIDIQIAILLLAGAAGSAMVPPIAAQAGASLTEAVSAMVTVVIATVITEPIVVALFMPPSVEVSAGDIAMVVLRSILLPLLIGLAIRTRWVRLANLITDPLGKIAGPMLKVVVILIIIKDLGTMWDFGMWNLLIMALFVAVWIGVGYLMGGIGGDSLPARITMSTITAWRNGAVVMLVLVQGGLVDQYPGSLPAAVAFQIVNMIMIMAFLGLVAKKVSPPGVEDESVPVSTEG